MGFWKYKYNVNRFVFQKTDVPAKTIAKSIFEDLDGKPGFEYFPLKDFLKVETDDEFDYLWEKLYDYCDKYRIWLGFVIDR